MMFCALKKMTWKSLIKIYDVLCIKKNVTWKSPIKIYDVLCIKKNDMEIPYQNLWCFVHQKKMTWKSPIKIYDVLCIKTNLTWKSPIKIYEMEVFICSIGKSPNIPRLFQPHLLPGRSQAMLDDQPSWAKGCESQIGGCLVRQQLGDAWLRL